MVTFMKGKGAPIVSLHDLFILKLQELYDIEQEIVKALPKMVKGATSEELSGLFDEHLQETQEQVVRLEKAFEALGEKAKKMKSNGIAGIIEDGKTALALKGEPSVLDAGLIACAQAIEHHEIALYGTALTWAKLMEHEEVASLLEETLDEEEMADEKLSDLAESIVNEEALAMSEDDTEEE